MSGSGCSDIQVSSFVRTIYHNPILEHTDYTVKSPALQPFSFRTYELRTGVVLPAPTSQKQGTALNYKPGLLSGDRRTIRAGFTAQSIAVLSLLSMRMFLPSSGTTTLVTSS